ncbi:MAG TPA: rod shape-determining protein MreC [Anaerolineae bacterium]|nr:rod shape-determining protein MreC [Anaerolineae bacterium]
MKRDTGPLLPWVLLVISILFLGLSGSGLLAPLESIFGFAITPLENTFAGWFDTLGTLTQTSRDVRALQQEVNDLQAANDLLVQENIRLREYAAENEQLRTQLNFAQSNPTYQLIGADVLERGCETLLCGDIVGQDTNPYLRYIIINVGTRHGVATGMPVVTGGAVLVGRVARVSVNLAYVQLINDPDSRIAAMLQQSRISGLVVGSVEGNMIMTEILPDETVNLGETIVTSAVGGLLPRGLILGQIDEVTYQESQLFQEANIRPAIDFRRLETVLVITDFPQPNLDELKNEE